MSIQPRHVEYMDGDQPLEGYLAVDDDWGARRPVVLVAHAIRGRTGFECAKAEALARLGYAGFALDVYGKGRVTDDNAAGKPWMQALLEDRAALQRRLRLGLEAAMAQPEVDAARIAAIGFCFGGLCVLDLARCEERVAGVASFHGLLDPPGDLSPRSIGAKVLVMHGWDDPLAPPESVLRLARELSDAGADWQLHAFGHVQHAFTNPAAASPASGLLYDAAADRRAWRLLQDFLAELFP
ncbi:dienelactone hydrolase family protein [Thioalkalivibrio sp. XN279]|uniref:dienelactone hydrolase family protein n=1 Tax=Thioalkalivibrio sp. XN279 TaxID=2714953 RepID=UPI001409CC44|nr:dienelactone hydrolase family protein [Thioalkalivibrio sp. XN279]NHA15103.1 dienelactone hydrolase family protein [Thioalkalivibrio sp. XN279]